MTQNEAAAYVASLLSPLLAVEDSGLSADSVEDRVKLSADYLSGLELSLSEACAFLGWLLSTPKNLGEVFEYVEDLCESRG